MLRIDDVTGRGGKAISIIAENANYCLAIATCNAVSCVSPWALRLNAGTRGGRIDLFGIVSVASSCVMTLEPTRFLPASLMEGEKGRRGEGQKGRRAEGEKGRRGEVAYMRARLNGCEGCESCVQVIQRTLAGTRHCAVAGCLLEEFIKSARSQIARYHANKFPLFTRIVYDPMDVAVIGAGDLLDADGAVRLGEIRSFLDFDASDDLDADGDFQRQWERFVSARLRRTMVEMRGVDDPWKRKIRSCVETAVSRSDHIHRIPERHPALYYRPEDGDARLAAEPLAMEKILSGLFERKAPVESVSGLIMAVYDILAMRSRCRRALTAAELTRIIVSYHGAFYQPESDDHVDEAAEGLDDADRRMFEQVVASLRSGRLAYYWQQGIYSAAECDKLASMVHEYLEDLWNLGPRSLTEYLQEVFPLDEQRWWAPEERKRFTNLLQLARRAVSKAWSSR
jgi:hypothetical protein